MTDPWKFGETDPTEELLAELEAAYGTDWLPEFTKNLRFDDDAQPVALPPVDEREIVRVRRVFLRLPWSVDQQLEAIGRAQGRGPSELVSAWIAQRLGEHSAVDRPAPSTD
ncbi:hypothetical protein AB0I30_23160 [Nocardia tengchongensis]|uniref:hypothetical protein n=1 Tax=Nocardia tengchongensis TaxID=2055889 RepID=UPI0033F049AE